jgi:hypothetical protein
LKQIHELLTERTFDVVGCAFDGDSYYGQLHKEFEKNMKASVTAIT